MLDKDVDSTSDPVRKCFGDCTKKEYVWVWPDCAT